MIPIKITLKDILFKLYTQCPFCGKSSFAMAGINRNSYWKRCFECGRNGEVVKLPQIKKKVLYLDQMAISNMMNSIRPSTNKSTKSRISPEWKVMFEKLDRLVKLQLIICPHSMIHEDESIVTPVFKDLQQMYEHLSHGTSFDDIETILRFQLYEAFTSWLKQDVRKIRIYDITHGDIDGWQERFRISINYPKKKVDYVKELERIRNQYSANLELVFNRWKTEKTKNFTDWFEEERSAYGPMYWRLYVESVLADDPENMFRFALSEKSVLILQLKSILRQQGFSDEKEILIKLNEFFNSESVKEVPYIKLYSMLCAALADQSAHQGRTQPPNQGTSNDLSFISAFTPYCDALFIDNPFREIIKQGDRNLKLGIYNKFYSANNFDEFFQYLDEIEHNTPTSHFEIVKEIYGEEWGKPYISMYEKSKFD